MPNDPTDWTAEEEAALRGLSRPEPSPLLEERVVRGLHERDVLRWRSRSTRLPRYAVAAVIGLLLALGGFAAGRWSAEPGEPTSTVVHEVAPPPDPIIVPADCPAPAGPQSPRATVPPARSRGEPTRSNAVAQPVVAVDQIEIPPSFEIYRVDADDRERMIVYF